MAVRHENPIDIEKLREMLDYNPETGEFRWKYKRRGKQPKQFGSLTPNGYLNTRIGQKRYLLHRLAWACVYGYWPYEVDHINRDRTDNRLCNLREATPSQNRANTRCRSKSGFKGVVKMENGKFRSAITVNRQWKCLGMYDTPQEAHERYVIEAKKVFGEFASAH